MNSALQALIGVIYEAALDPRRWPEFLHLYIDAVGAPSGAMLYHDVRDRRGAVSVSVGIGSDALSEYNQHFVGCDVWLYASEARGLLASGAAIIDDEVVPREQLHRSEYYNDFAEGHGLSRMLGGVIRRDGMVTSSVTALRPDSGKPFSEQERRSLRLILPHLYRAMQIHRRIAGADLANAALQDALDGMPLAAIVVRDDSRIVFANRAALEILGQQDGLVSEKEGLKACVADEHRALQSLVRTAAATAAGTGLSAGGALSVSRPSLKPSLDVLVTPLRTQTLVGSAPASGMAIVFVADGDRMVSADPGVLQALWNLTPTEAAVAVELAAGRSTAEIAARFDVSVGTARWHVKRVLAKTGSRRQSDLIRRVTTSPAIVNRPGGDR